MSKIEIAYSLEYGKCIDALEAHKLYWDGKIKDKQAFQCCDENCNAQITCANLDKKHSEMKRSPSFRRYGEHSSECKHKLDYIEKNTSKNPKPKGGSIMPYTGNCDVFIPNRPQKHAHINKTTGKNEPKTKAVNSKPQKKSTTTTTRRNPQQFCIKPLVSKFLTYTPHLSNIYISIEGFKHSYRELFIDMQTLDIGNIPKHDSVYFGTGTIKKKADNYTITFDNGFLMGNNHLKTYCVLKKQLIDEYLLNNTKEDELKRVAKEGERITIYVYCKPYKWDSEGKSTIFLNISNLDHIDFR